jgi:hypothetical protein
LTTSLLLDEYPCWPHFLPDGEHILVSTDTNGAFVVSVDGKNGRRFTDPSFFSRVEYADGYLFFGREGSLFAQSFDAGKMSLTGEPFRVADGVGFSMGDNLDYAFSVSPGGTLVYASSTITPVTQLTWFTRAGQRLRSLGEPGEHVGFAVSPNAQMVVLERHDVRDSEFGLWLMEVGSGALSKLSVDRPNGRRFTGTPVWSRFDDRIYFATMPGLARQSSRVRVEETLSAEPCWLSDVSPDGNHALLLKNALETGNDLWILPLSGGKELKPYLTTKHSESGGRFSPDGRWVAYASDESGRLEVYVQSFPESGRPVTIARNGGQNAEWRQDGKELYFLTLDGKLFAVTVDGALSPFRVSEPKLLFSTGITADLGRQQFYPDENGERFLVNSQVEDKSAPALKVVLNWKALLKNR